MSDLCRVETENKRLMIYMEDLKKDVKMYGLAFSEEQHKTHKMLELLKRVEGGLTTAIAQDIENLIEELTYPE